jgi:hypothetical protein
MKFPKSIIGLILACTFSVCIAAQTLPDGFIFENANPLILQVQPDTNLIPKQVADYGTYQALGLVSYLLNDQYVFTIVNAQPEKGDLIFKKQKNAAVTITADGEKIVGIRVLEISSSKVGKTKYEGALVQISREDFEKIVAADKLYVEFGKFTHLASAENLQAFHYLSDRLEKAELPEGASTPHSSAPSSVIHVKGYYRKDGTYVKPHTRRRPKN